MPHAALQNATFEEPHIHLRDNDNGYNVLLVEDDTADTYLITTALQNDRRIKSIVHARDGVDALEIIDHKTFAPDFVILDLQMPRKDGFSLLVELGCRLDNALPKIVLTSSVARGDQIRSRLRGADLVLTKPNSIKEFEILLRAAIATIQSPYCYLDA